MTEGTEMRPLPPAVQPRLVCLTGDLKGSTILLDEEELTFGRVSSNRVRISDPHVSRRHATDLAASERRTSSSTSRARTAPSSTESRFANTP